jgi:thiamine-monophosphate kinase
MGSVLSYSFSYGCGALRRLAARSCIVSPVPSPELKLIAALRQAAGRPSGAKCAGEVLVSIGDDCALLQGGRGNDLLVTTDLTLEGTHFRREWHSASLVGHRSLARGLSDIAAMGGDPTAAFLSLGLPAKIEQRWVSGFLAGFLRLAKRYRVQLAGGDTAESKSGVIANVMVVGRVSHGQAVLRSGARPGDRIYVSGVLGGATAELMSLRAGKRAATGRGSLAEPRLKLGRRLRGLTSSMIDLSDGLSTDLRHICQESGAGAVIIGENVPVAKTATFDLALNGGEDYELLFTAPPHQGIPREVAGVKVTLIGEVIASHEIWLERAGRRRRLDPRGWEHFRKGNR